MRLILCLSSILLTSLRQNAAETFSALSDDLNEWKAELGKLLDTKLSLADNSEFKAFGTIVVKYGKLPCFL